VIRLWSVATVDGVEVSGEVEVEAGSWGDYWSPAEAPEVVAAALTDALGRPVEVDLDDEWVHTAILGGVEWPCEGGG
jgi:hypothetical protein